MKEKFLVVGDPIAHSLSPFIHQQFAHQFSMQVNYRAYRLTREHFHSFCTEFFASGGCGMNVTMPLKAVAFSAVAHHSPDAALAQAVNTISRNHDQLMGHNTDGNGLVNDLLRNWQISLKDKSILILGAGGASAGIIPSLLKQSPDSITLWARNQRQSEALVTRFHDSCLRNVTHEIPQAVDLLINATGAGAHEAFIAQLRQMDISPEVAYDLAYGDNATGFLHWAQQSGAKLVCSGLGMLVEQAALAFEIWHQVRPNSRHILQSLQQNLII